jgi:hypothetical protein
VAADFRLEVAHILSAESRPDLAFELSNVRTLDRKCHVLETQAERSGENSPGRQAWRELLKSPLPERNDNA